MSLVEEIAGVERIKLALGAHTAVERFAVGPFLDVAKTSRDAAIAARVEGIEVDRGADIAERTTVVTALGTSCSYDLSLVRAMGNPHLLIFTRVKKE